MTVYKRYRFEDGCETFCAFIIDNPENYVEIVGAENLHGEWYYFTLDTLCNCGKLDDQSYIEWLLYDENDGNGFSCGSFDSLEKLIDGGAENYFDASVLRYFLTSN